LRSLTVCIDVLPLAVQLPFWHCWSRSKSSCFKRWNVCYIRWFLLESRLRLCPQ